MLLLDKDKEKILGTLQTSIHKEKDKMETLYTADLQVKERQHQGDLEELKKALQRETRLIEESLTKQEEMSEQLVKVKKQTVKQSTWEKLCKEQSSREKRSSDAEKMKWQNKRLMGVRKFK